MIQKYAAPARCALHNFGWLLHDLLIGGNLNATTCRAAYPERATVYPHLLGCN
jgi:hypothetical protein